MGNKELWRLDIGTDLSSINWSGPNFNMKASSNIGIDKMDAEEWKHQAREVDTHKGIVPGCDTLISDTFTCGDIELKRQVGFDSEDLSKFNIRLIVKNTGNVGVKFMRLTPISVKGQDALKIGDYKAGEWGLLRQGRHKNDLPSTCVLGVTDARYMDALKGLSETGSKLDRDGGQVPLGIVSDELTVIKGKSPGALLLGFITAMSQLVEVKISLDRSRENLEELQASCLLDGILLEPGEERIGEWLRLDADEDVFSSIDEFTDLKADMSKSYAEPDPPTVYCTWYYYGITVSHNDIKTEIKGLKEHDIPIDVFQIDDGWQRQWGNWEPNEKFPLGMKAVADEIQSNNYRPGIWTCPFIIEPMCEIRCYHPDWLLKDSTGTPIRFTMSWMNNFVLDVTHPEVLRWIEALYSKLTAEWGYTYHKLDFTRAVAINTDAQYYDKSATRAEAYRRGIEAVRRGAGPDAYISICGGLYGASSGLINAQRTGSDVVSIWPSKPEGSSEIVAPYTIKQTALRYWMNNLWHNDADALMVRRRTKKYRNLDLSLGLLTDDEAIVSTLNQYICGGIVCFSEPMREIDKDRAGLLRHIIPSIGKPAIPRDMFSENRYPCIYDVPISTTSGLDKWHTVAIINWMDVSTEKDFTLDESTLGEFAKMHERFIISEFWTGKIWTDIKYGDKIELGEVRPHSARLLKVTPQTDDKPVLIYSNGHFSMGGTEIRSWEYSDKKLRMSIEWPWDCPVEFIVQGVKGRPWASGSQLYKVDSEDKERARIQLPGKFCGSIELVEA